MKIEIMPALFQVKSGVIDYDEFILEPIDAAPIVEKKKKEEEDLEYILSLVKQSIKKNKK
ncbi:MAG: hypothetical protein PF692_07445 [Kiritimatiellae bacterium]|nr:hypothetical protein [Kiritimatiellia bacterium]